MKKAFTLAEVLITLATIGIVAALTIPTLIKNYQNKVYVTALQKNYSQIQNGLKLMIASEGVEYLTQTELYTNGITPFGSFKNSALTGYLGKYLKVEKACNGTPDCFPNWQVAEYKIEISDKNNNSLFSDESLINCTSDSRYVCMRLSDGTIVKFNDYFSNLWGGAMGLPFTYNESDCSEVKSLGGNMCSVTMRFYIDVNGENKPNLLGRDVFEFYVDNLGTIYPAGSVDVALKRGQSKEEWEDYWKNGACNPENGEQGSVEEDFDGDGMADNIKATSYQANAACTARVLETGKMDY